MSLARGGCIEFLRRSLNRVALTETSETAKYTKSVSPASGLARTGGFSRYCLIAVRLHHTPHSTWPSWAP